MTANILDHAQAALALGETIEEGELPILSQEGDLQGRKVTPLAFYLHITGAVVGCIVTVALIIAAIAFPIFTFYMATAVCLLLVLTNAMGAFCCYSFAPEEELISLISKLSDKIFSIGTLNAEISLTKIVEGEGEISQNPEFDKLREEIRKLEQENAQLKGHLKTVEKSLGSPTNRLQHSWSIDPD